MDTSIVPWQTKDFKFQIKGVSEDGTFEGMAAVYGNVDLGDDIIAPGAFTKTLSDSNQRPILWQHRQSEPIGIGEFTDSAKGLAVNGKLVLESDIGSRAHALMKAKVVKGLSIGYDPVVSEYDRENEVRTLKEVRLWEASVVTFPMNPKAQITGVKAIADDFDAALGRLAQFVKEAKEGRTLSAATMERIKAAHGSMRDALGHMEALLSMGQEPATTCSADSLLAGLNDFAKQMRWN